MKKYLKKSLIQIFIAAFCLLPAIAIGDDGKCIEGDCVNGNGIYLFSSGEKYNGEFRNGEINGDGIYTYPDGSKYIGEFTHGVRHGQGIFKIVTGTTYIGQWANDLPDGQGVKTLADGMQYSGEFKNGLMYGSGTLVMPDNSKLTVKWNNAQPLQEDWYKTTTPGETRKLISQKSQQDAKDMEVSSQDMNIGEETPSQDFDQSAVTPEQIAPQASKADVISVKDMKQTEEGSKSQMPAEEMIKSETPTHARKQDYSEPEEQSPPSAETTNTVEYASISVGANIRSQPLITSEVLRTVPPGYPVIVIEKRTDWLKVEDYRGRKGWIHASLVTTPGTVIIKVFKGNLRSGPSLEDDILVQLDHGTILSVLERKGEWLKVSDLKELTGWLNFKVVWPAEVMIK